MCTGLLVPFSSQSFWMGYIPASSLMCLCGWRRMDSAGSNLKSAAQIFGWCCRRARGPYFAVFGMQCWADSAPILHWRLPFWGNFLMLQVQMHLPCLCMKVRMFFQGLLQATWEVVTVPNSWSNPHLISGWWGVASSGLLRLKLGALTRSPWRNC